MSGVDVRNLAKERLPAGAFPVQPHADFRLHISPTAIRGIEEHAKADVSVEICGVLVGHWGSDENGPYALVTDYIRCDNAASKGAEVTFTHDSWSQINKEMDSRFADKRIVGWYHSHPDFGVFLSERDCFIHEHFFSGPGQVALVVDPVRELQGVFAWRNGKPAPMSHYWVGDTIRTVELSQRNPAASSMRPTASIETEFSPHTSPSPFGSSTIGLATTMLGLLTVFLLGYLYGGWRTDWEQRMVMAGAVAHFADTNLIRDGLREELTAVRARLQSVNNEFNKLPSPTAELKKEEAEEAQKGRKFIQDNLALCEAALTRIEEEYGLNDVERSVVRQIAAAKLAELRRQMNASVKAPDEKKTGEASSKNENGKQNRTEPAKKAEPSNAPATAPAKQNGSAAG